MLDILVCENIYLEVTQAIGDQYPDVRVIVYPCFCKKGDRGAKHIVKWLNETIIGEAVILCNQNCLLLELLLQRKPQIRTYSTPSCFHHLCDGQVIEDLEARKQYIVTLSYLGRWKSNLQSMGFGKDTARLFFRDNYRGVTVLDTGIGEGLVEQMSELSSYIGIPCSAVQISLSMISLYIKSIVSEWRLVAMKRDQVTLIRQYQQENSEYAAMIDIMTKMAVLHDEREVIRRVTEFVSMIFNASQCEYFSVHNDLQNEFKLLAENSSRQYIMLEDQNRFIVSVNHEGEVYGVFNVGAFALPQYLSRYLKFMINIATVCGLVVYNAREYKKVLDSELKIREVSRRDGLTGLYNRAWFYETINQYMKDQKRIAVFIFDVDDLKKANDNFGHIEGDRLISSAAAFISRNFRDSDIVARIGGDEFAAVIADANEGLTNTIYARMQHELANLLTDSPNRLKLSMGYKLADSPRADPNDVIREADMMMYQNKAYNKSMNI